MIYERLTCLKRHCNNIYRYPLKTCGRSCGAFDKSYGKRLPISFLGGDLAGNGIGDGLEYRCHIRRSRVLFGAMAVYKTNL